MKKFKLTTRELFLEKIYDFKQEKKGKLNELILLEDFFAVLKKRLEIEFNEDQSDKLRKTISYKYDG